MSGPGAAIGPQFTYENVFRTGKPSTSSCMGKPNRTSLSFPIPIEAPQQNGPQQDSFMELKVLRKEVWKGVDADEYVARQRDAWVG